MVRHRPNDDCLWCGEKLTRPPSTTRAFYYCDESCWRPCNRSLRFFNPEIPSRSRGTPMSLVAQVWWVMRQAKMPLTAKQLHGRILDNFGDNPRLKAKTGFQKS